MQRLCNGGCKARNLRGHFFSYFATLLPMLHLQFIPNSENAESELTSLGLLHPYTIEEDGQEIIGGFASCALNPTHSTPHATLPIDLDWAAQWAAFAPGYDGTHLEIHGHKFRIDPGPGFGDLSHPTTSLMTDLMRAHVKGRNVVDIGCGSGILSLLAAHLGAASILAVDIDPEAISHSKHNFTLNNLDITPTLEMPPLPDNPLLLINMTRGEQEALFAAHPHLLDHRAIVSGLQQNQRPLHPISQLKTKTVLQNWSACIFT